MENLAIERGFGVPGKLVAGFKAAFKDATSHVQLKDLVGAFPTDVEAEVARVSHCSCSGIDGECCQCLWIVAKRGKNKGQHYCRPGTELHNIEPTVSVPVPAEVDAEGATAEEMNEAAEEKVELHGTKKRAANEQSTHKAKKAKTDGGEGLEGGV